MNLKGDGWSVNIVKWNFFVNTKASKCVAYGPGLFDSDNAGWGFPAVFKVQAKDTAGRNRSSGGEAAYWKPKVRPAPPKNPPPTPLNNRPEGNPWSPAGPRAAPPPAVCRERRGAG